LSWFRRAATTIGAAPDSTDALLEHTRILSDIGWVYFMQRILDRAQEHLEQALARISSLDHYDEQAHILNRLGGVAYIRGDLALAQHYVEQSLDASARSGNLVAQASTLNNLGNLTGSQGRTADSIRYGLEALEINERIGNRRELAVTANNLGWAFYDQEEYQQAYTYFNQASQIASETRDTYVQMFALLNLGLSLTALQRWDRAEEAMQQSLFIACQLELNAQQLEIHVALAELALKQEKNDLAVHEYLQGAALASDTESEEYGKFQRLEARIAFLRGERERALELLKASEALFVRLHNVPEAGRTRKLIDELATPGIARPNQPDKVVK
jgi:tetratricopeptide (TPR) repeat protein